VLLRGKEKNEEREGGKEKEIKKGRVERGNFVPASWRESGWKKIKANSRR